MRRGNRGGLALAAATSIVVLGACGQVPPISTDAAPTTAPSSAPATSAEPTASPAGPTTTTAPTASATPSADPSAPPSTTQPAAVLARGDSGEKVRELQVRLRQLDWFGGTITGRYADSTVKGVKGFQDKRKLPDTGTVDAATWSKLTGMTRTPTAAEKHNKLVPGPALWKRGATGDKVRELQARLKQIGWFSGNVTDSFGTQTEASVRGFQGKRAIPVTGEVDQRTWDRLTAMTRTPTDDELHNVAPKPSAAGLDSRCVGPGVRALCISKANNSLVWVVNGTPQLRVDVRFGSAELPTREGAFSVGWKSRNHVSTIYHTPMPYAMFFSGGQAVHYSPDFAARGYNGASHGCVNVRNLSAIQGLFDDVRVGDRVIVYR